MSLSFNGDLPYGQRTRAEHILGTVDDLVADFLYYDRKENEELPQGAIQAAILEGEISAELIIERFTAVLMEALGT